MLGGLVREATRDLKASVNAPASEMVTQQELDWRRPAEDRALTDANVKDLRDGRFSCFAAAESISDLLLRSL